MAIKKRSQPNAEFNMSSLTDIIFLLLIFFMLTSSLVNPNALNLKLPGRSNSSTVIPDESKIPQVVITNSGQFRLDGKAYSKAQIESTLRKERGKTVIIAPQQKAPIEQVAAVMDMAMRFNINAILAADE